MRGGVQQARSQPSCWAYHARPFVAVFEKSISSRFNNFWRQFPSKAMKRLQERQPDTPTIGLRWWHRVWVLFFGGLGARASSRCFFLSLSLSLSLALSLPLSRTLSCSVSRRPSHCLSPPPLLLAHSASVSRSLSLCLSHSLPLALYRSSCKAHPRHPKAHPRVGLYSLDNLPILVLFP